MTGEDHRQQSKQTLTGLLYVLSNLEWPPLFESTKRALLMLCPSREPSKIVASLENLA